jgi:AcrR family transcriptional regulator
MITISTESRGRNHQILGAAIDLIAAGGVGNATIKTLCDRAGVTPPAIYYHYGNKDGLVAAVVEHSATQWFDGLVELVQARSSAIERVRAAVEIWRTEILDPRSPIKLLMRIQLERAQLTPALRESLASVMEHGRSAIGAALESSAGPLDAPEDLAQTVISLVQGAALQHDLDGDDAALSSRLEYVGQTILRLIEKSRISTPAAGESAPRPENTP